MPRTVQQGFEKFLTDLVPSSAERAVAAKHRESVERSLDAGLGIKRFKQTGSLHHGTGVTIYSDVDYLASLKGAQPSSSDAALRNVRDCLKRSFPYTDVHVDRPAVVINFAGGNEAFEVAPGWLKRGEADTRVYAIPGRGSGWIESAPDAHLNYVNASNNAPSGGAKGLARLLKAWKYYRDVPISSFYLEMQAARYMLSESSVIWSIDLLHILKRLQDDGLAAMNDPSRLTGRIHACGTEAQKTTALSRLNTAVTRAENARAAEEADRHYETFDWWSKLFNGGFPSR